jgi:hypothetical protein
MSQVDKSAVHDFTTGETVTETMLDQNTEVLRVANNDNDARIKVLENAQAGAMTGIRSGTAFPTNPVPKAGDKFYRVDLEKEYVYSLAGTWDALIKEAVADSEYAKNSGRTLVEGFTDTYTVPYTQTTKMAVTITLPQSFKSDADVKGIQITPIGDVGFTWFLDWTLASWTKNTITLNLRNTGYADGFIRFSYQVSGNM